MVFSKKRFEREKSAEEKRTGGGRGAWTGEIPRQQNLEQKALSLPAPRETFRRRHVGSRLWAPLSVGERHGDLCVRGSSSPGSGARTLPPLVFFLTVSFPGGVVRRQAYKRSTRQSSSSTTTRSLRRCCRCSDCREKEEDTATEEESDMEVGRAEAAEGVTRVLVVDDSPVDRRVAQLLLSSSSCAGSFHGQHEPPHSSTLLVSCSFLALIAEYRVDGIILLTLLLGSD
jgi:hypothetical protein